MRRISKVAVALAAATAAALLFTPGGHAVPDALKTYVVPGQCVQPESVTVRDGYFYTGGICNGNIYRGDLRERRAEVFVSGGATTLQAGIKATATRLVVTGIWLFALTVAYPYIPGSETAAFKGVSVFVGLMLSLGSAGALSQIVSGFVVLYSRAIRVGDFVRIDDKEGVVVDVGLLSLKLATRLREEVTIPNTVLAGAAVNNYTRRSREEGLFVATSVSIGYDTPWRQVHALLELAASRTPDILQSPKPYVLETSLSDFYVQYQLCAAIAKPTDRPFVLSRLHAEIQDAFNEYGVQIMSPNFEAQPDAKVWVPREHWDSAPAGKPAA